MYSYSQGYMFRILACVRYHSIAYIAAVLSSLLPVYITKLFSGTNMWK